MRLINLETYELKEFETKFSDERKFLPPYAVLSHRWFPEGEVLYRHCEEGRLTSHGPERSNQKIKKFCRIAAAQTINKRGEKLKWAWVDTCCIDQSNPTEQTEAINSMFQLYKHAAVCIVYLKDILKDHSLPGGRGRRDRSAPGDGHAQGAENFHSLTVPMPHENNLTVKNAYRSRARSDPGFRTGKEEKIEKFTESEWFKRGWTLQELIAPSNHLFFDQQWAFLGHREDLKYEIRRATGIRNIDIPEFYNDASVAQRMSWASRRETSKGEDKAYCLLGLFNVTMPIMYGEGEDNAFYRLQLEIIKQNDDESIFAWDSDPKASWKGMLAPSPKEFAMSYDVVRHAAFGHNRPFSMTNKGLEIHCYAIQIYQESKNRTFFDFLKGKKKTYQVVEYKVPLNCRRVSRRLERSLSRPRYMSRARSISRERARRSDSAQIDNSFQAEDRPRVGELDRSGERSGTGELSIVLVGFKNISRLVRRGPLQPTDLTISLPSVHADYNKYFHDFRVPQNISWVWERDWDNYEESNEIPGGFDRFEAKMRQNTIRRQGLDGPQYLLQSLR